MKTINKLSLSVLLAIIFFFAGCADKSTLTDPSTATVATGTANFSRFVSIGNSITSGYQSSSLYQDGQMYSFPNQIAGQVKTSYVQPLVANPGIGGRIDIQSLNLSTGSVVLYTNPANGGAPLNSNYAAPFNNLGVPGAVLGDVIHTTDFVAQAAAPRNNPFFQVVLRSSALGTSIFEQAKVLQPTFLTLWIGNNDVLGYATSGGTSPSAPTTVTQFTALYGELVGSIKASLPTTKVAVGNIPSVTSIPFFTTVGPMVGMALKAELAGVLPASALLTTPVFVYQKHEGGTGVGVASINDLLSGSVLLTLVGSNYAPLIGTSTGQFWRDHGVTNPAGIGIDTTKPFGLSATNPFPDALVLDPAEITNAVNAVAGFNSAISNLVSSEANFALVDVNALLNSLRSNDYGSGTVYDGITFKTSFITGGMFSLDGVHPSNQGHAILANAFIASINAKFGAAIPKINVASLPSSLHFHKTLPMSSIGLPVFPVGTFDNLLF